MNQLVPLFKKLLQRSTLSTFFGITFNILQQFKASKKQPYLNTPKGWYNFLRGVYEIKEFGKYKILSQLELALSPDILVETPQFIFERRFPRLQSKIYWRSTSLNFIFLSIK